MIRHPCLEVDVPFDLFLCNRPYTPTVLIPELHLLLCTASAKINISYSILFNLTTSYSSYFGGKKGISWNKTSFFLLMATAPSSPSILPLFLALDSGGSLVHQQNQTLLPSARR